MLEVGSTSSSAFEMRTAAKNLFLHALRESSVDQAFQRNLSCNRGVLRICEDLYDLNSYSRVSVISIGKAAHTMVDALRTQAGDRFEGIVAGPPVDHQIRGFQYFYGGHPLPNDDSVQAARAILNSLSHLHAEALAIFLLSGGGSSMVEQPIDDEISLEDLVFIYTTLIHSGAPIGEVNAIRKHLSAVKGGRLAQAASPAQQVSLLVSDVPDAMPDALASGPTMPDATSAADCYAIAWKYNLPIAFPRSARKLFNRRALEETPKSGDPAFGRSRWWTVLSNATLLDAAKAEAERLGFHVEIDNTCDDWDYLRARDYLLERLRELRHRSGRVCLISGGEITVKLANGGVGGRNQQFALSCAASIAGEQILILSAGTDGIDGNSPAAGAIVDGDTVGRAKKLGLTVEKYLHNFDAYSFFAETESLIMTGATGNNLRDMRLLLAY